MRDNNLINNFQNLNAVKNVQLINKIISIIFFFELQSKSAENVGKVYVKIVN